ncbi:O-antigen ligase family protein [Rhodanobacter sp. C06]|uniref:O-antigen ligase family protein n=1 Tax=Rhodanobacter sp. C06 TaxID=1945854 RepID=UPI000985FDBC|nr:O-antigen ligase family protein [Rhodanobacter sp. C06]
MFLLILVYLAFAIVRPQDFLPGMAGLPVMSLTLLLAFIGWLLRGARTPGAPQFLLLPLFVLIAMASEVVTGWAGGMQYVIEQMGPSLIVFFVLASAIDDPRRTAATFAVIGLCAMVLALHSVQQASHGVGWTGMTLGEDGRIRYVGIFNDPNDLGLLFVMALPMLFCVAARAGFLGRWFWRAGIVLLLAGIYLTKSRGTQLAVLMMGAIWLWQKRGLLTAGSLSFAGLVGLTLLPSTRMNDLDPDEESAFGRVDAWYEGFDMFKTHPLFGVGFGNFTDYNRLTAHNSFVLVLAETGFLGFVTWLAFVGYGFWMMWRLLRLQAGLAQAAQVAVAHVVAARPQARLALVRALPAGADAEQRRTTVVRGPAAVVATGAGTAADRADTAAQQRQDRAEQALSLTLFCALCGFFTAAFFLSRSYNIMLYTLAAIVVGHYASLRKRHDTLPRFTLSASGWRWLPISLMVIAALYVLVAVLLRMP